MKTRSRGKKEDNKNQALRNDHFCETNIMNSAVICGANALERFIQ